MGKELTFENYRVPGFDKKLDYRYETFIPLGSMFQSREKNQEERKINEEAQKKASRYADGTHGYDYYEHAGDGVDEIDAVIRRFREIPRDRWVRSPGMKTVEEDMSATFERLKAAAPPAFMNAGVTAAFKKSMGTKRKKTLQHQLRDYKEMRANWEKSEKGQRWLSEIKRLQAMEKGKLKEDPEALLQISAPVFVGQDINVYEKIEGITIDPQMAGKVNKRRNLGKFGSRIEKKKREQGYRPETSGIVEKLDRKYAQPVYGPGYHADLTNADKTLTITGTNASRLLVTLAKKCGKGLSESALEGIFDKLMAVHKADLDLKDTAAVAQANQVFDSAMLEIKEFFYRYLKRLEATFGTLITQMHPEDFLRQMPDDIATDFALLQDFDNLLNKGAKYFDLAGNDKDKEFKKLTDYYNNAWYSLLEYMEAEGLRSSGNDVTMQIATAQALRQTADGDSDGIGGPHMDAGELADYRNKLGERAQKENWGDRFF
ncbi:MAG: hypothetical protein J6X66_12505 [Lachnospiraceae bacterium]|nr:hypothetical protein [Lachnospiraceae bacterium]